MPDFLSRSQSPALVKQAEREGAYRGLVAEANSLAPDVDAITSAIMDKKLYSSNKRPYLDAVNGIVGDYLSKFDKDPFYAFSREGRSAAGQLKQIVNHPDILDLEQRTAASEAEYKKATERNLNKNYVVRGNEVLAFKDGRRQYVPISQLRNLDTERDGLLTVDDDINLLRNHIGVREQSPSYDMSKLEDIDKKIYDALAKLGSTDSTGVLQGNDTDLKVRNKANINQIRSVVNMLKNQGLTESDRNTLKSEYLKSSQDPSSRGFDKWLDDKLNGIAEGRIETIHDEIPEESLRSKLGGKGSGGSNKTVELSAASRIMNGLTGQRNVVNIGGGTGQALKGNVLPVQETLNNSSSHFKDELGNLNANRTLNQLKVFSDATDLKNLSVLSPKDNQWVKIPALAQHGVVLDKPGTEPALVYQYTYRDENGEPSTVPPPVAREILERQNSGQKLTPQLQRYLTTVPIEQAEREVMLSSTDEQQKAMKIASLRASVRPDGTVSYLDNKPWVDVTVGLPRPRGPLDSAGPEADALGKQASNLGYRSIESPDFNDYYARHSGKGALLKSGLWGVNDEMYEVHARVPLTSFEQLNTAYGGKTLGQPEDIHIDTSRLRDNYLLMSPQLFDQGSIPNMAARKGFVSIDDIQ